jgi:hypothetical protein
MSLFLPSEDSIIPLKVLTLHLAVLRVREGSLLAVPCAKDKHVAVEVKRIISTFTSRSDEIVECHSGRSSTGAVCAYCKVSRLTLRIVS